MKKLLLLMALSLTVLSAGKYQFGKFNFSSSTAAITEVQKAELLYLYQEEKVARDVYITLGKLYPQERTFSGIQNSEQNHMDAVKNLCLKYNVDIDGVNDTEVGVFVLYELQDMYNSLIVKGQESLIQALYVGRYIEITDIKDLEDAKDGMPFDVQRTLSRLIIGSENHLEAFENAINRTANQ